MADKCTHNDKANSIHPTQSRDGSVGLGNSVTVDEDLLRNIGYEQVREVCSIRKTKKK